MPRTSFDDVNEPAFAGSEGLRVLLERLHKAGAGAWRTDPEAAELMRFTARRYGALARKFGMEPEDAAVAAFEAMLNDSTRKADDPWAVVTVAVRITLIAEQRAHGLLTSTERARRPQFSVFHDAERFSDRETELTEYHPAFRTLPPDEQDTAGSTDAGRAVESTVTLLVLLGWDEDTGRGGIEYICSRLLDYGDRAAAYDALRRDKSARALLDLPHASWIGLLRITLGHPTAASANARRGTLVRLLIGDSLADLLSDDDLVLAVTLAAPRAHRGGDDG
ncbi:hypothetical protein [Arthrobacter russicus]|uniref:Serine/arginine repetitive matrix protein 2 n=1 Tax=Arthrobacter russicus TaxID=172040 RepID=A0ABU1JHV9_9MICC|nr:hypothetical protein [Arthrobacter russicus]MDR6270962.1 hypothetical protein [Arthrobacter russicus]